MRVIPEVIEMPAVAIFPFERAPLPCCSCTRSALFCLTSRNQTRRYRGICAHDVTPGRSGRGRSGAALRCDLHTARGLDGFWMEGEVIEFMRGPPFSFCGLVKEG